jgi:uncharacterized protein DUF4255
MSNHLAIATVTATLDKLLEKRVDTDVPGAKVTMVRPDTTGAGLPATRVNIFLYQVTPSAAARNEDLPTRSPDGLRTTTRPRVGLDLHYLFTFYGREVDFEPQRLLGSVVRTLHERPVLTRSKIGDAITAFPLLGKSNLADDVELVKFTQLPLTLEELSKLWSVFFQTAYQLSVAYQGTLVLIESDDTASSPLPVKQRNLYVDPFREPLVEQVVAASGDDDPIVAGAPIRVRGKRLRGNKTQLLVDGSPAPAAGVTDTEITAALPALDAGLHALQVEHVREMGTPAVDHGGVASNVASFVLTPEITKTGANYDIALANQGVETGGTHRADVTVHVSPPVSERQRVALVLNELGGAHAYTFPDGPRTGAPTPTIEIHVGHVAPGQYLVRIQVDGADSVLEPKVGPFAAPVITL